MTEETTLAALRLNVELDAIAYMLFLDTWTHTDEAISDIDSALLHRLRKKWVTQWLPAKNEPHCGDCTNVAAPCVRCGVERLYEDAARILKASNEQN